MMHKLLIATAALALCTPALADTLVDNVEGVTIDAAGGVERFTGLLIGDDGRIVQVLHRGDKRPGKVDYFVDGKGQVMVPGMIDSHGHVMGLGFSALTLDLTETTSLAEALAKVAAYAKANPDRPWILGRGWNQELWPEKRFPTAAELDAVVPDRPVWLTRVDGHAGWANSQALATAGVTAATRDPAGGKIERLGATGKPAGVLVDTATDLIDSKVPAPRRGELVRLLTGCDEGEAAARALLGDRAAAGGHFWAELERFPKPVIAAVEKLALGGGTELALACDIAIAGESTKFGVPEVKLGAIPGAGGTQRLIHAIGKSKAMALLLTGDFIDARKACDAGMVAEVTADGQALPTALAMERRRAGSELSTGMAP